MAPQPSTSLAPPPALAQSRLAALSAEDEDKLSDFVPGSADLSRVASRQESEKEAQEDDAEDEDEYESEEDDEDGGAVMKDTPKTPRQVRQETEKAERASARKAQKAQREDRNAKLTSRRKAVDAGKVADSIKRFSYLLGQTDLFRHFCDLKAQREPEFAELLAQSEAASKGKKSRKGASARGRKSEKEEDAELLAADEAHDHERADGASGERDDEPFVFTESPSYVKGGEMRDYQVQGLNWMISLFHNGINGILADEMGLGKTLQTISFLGYLKNLCGIPGPHLVVVPKSTLDNWEREFHRWVPSFDIVKLQGDKETRHVLCQERILTQDFQVCLTTYEICLREKSSLRKVGWEYIIIDEAHRIKNVDSMLSQIVREFESRARLLITGTPLQNNLQELWALLNFLLPDVFSSAEDFDAWFQRERGDGDEADAENSVVKQLHKVLRPFLLRRVKADVEKSLLPKKEINVYVGMTELQRKWYRMILEKDIDAVNGATGKKEGKTRLMNIVMQLRKCCNHPYLFDGAEPGPPFTTDEHLVDNAGKMIIIDKLLKSMKVKGSRVLIFSQMSRVLDILEDYCMFREYEYCRIDGSTQQEDRIASIDEFNKEGSSKFVFLLTTRAGGLGINLTSADIVILYDSDWNPQADLQAMDRAHRIGQKKQVIVFRFVTEDAVEEKVLERAAQKLRLDQLVIQQGRANVAGKAASKDDLVDMIQHGAERIINNADSMLAQADDIDDIIARGEERTKELNAKYQGLDFDDLANFKTEAAGTQQWEGQDYAAARAAGKPFLGLKWIEPPKRERKMNYSENVSFRDLMRGGPPAPKKKRPKKLDTLDWQFFPPRFMELQEKADLAYKKANGIKAELPEPEDSEKVDAEDLERQRQEMQAEIDNAEELTPEEMEEKEDLQALGFEHWSKKDFLAFIKGCELHGRDNPESVTKEVEGKTLEEVREYSAVFWDRYEEIEDHQRYITRIEVAEARRRKTDRSEELLTQKVKGLKHPMQSLKIVYVNQTKGKSYSEEEDRFLVVQLQKYGLGKDDVYDLIKRDILDSPLFRFDWFIKSRTPLEIARRCTTLVQLIVKELDPEDLDELTRKRPPNKKKADADAGGGLDDDDVDSEVAGPSAAPAKANGAANGNANGTAKGRGKKRKAAGDETRSASGSRASTPAAGSAVPRKKGRAS